MTIPTGPMDRALTDKERALANRGRLAELGDELKALDKISKKSCDPEALRACAKRAVEISVEVRRLQGLAVRETGRLLREMGLVHKSAGRR